ncbi:MAG: S8 family serine peptidase [Candidatus Omnitrophica bacterium]|nr:S8 family serine peptidase [Candidatus Omnitrophota bacterium]
METDRREIVWRTAAFIIFVGTLMLAEHSAAFSEPSQKDPVEEIVVDGTALKVQMEEGVTTQGPLDRAVSEGPADSKKGARARAWRSDEVIVKFKGSGAGKDLSQALAQSLNVQGRVTSASKALGVRGARALERRIDFSSARPLIPEEGDRASAGRARPTRFQDVWLMKVKAGMGKGIEAICEELSKDPLIEYAQPNYQYETNAWPLPRENYIPNDAFLGDEANPGTYRQGSWGQNYPDLWGLAMIRAIEAWNEFDTNANGRFDEGETKPGEGVIVAVLDTGLDYNHPDIENSVWLNQRELMVEEGRFPAGLDADADGVVTPREAMDFTGDLDGNGSLNLKDVMMNPKFLNRFDEDRNGFRDDILGWDFSGDGANGVYPDRDPYELQRIGHGTHVAGTIAAEADNTIGIAGVAPFAKVMPIKIFPLATTAVVVRAIYYAANGPAHILSNSWGPTRENYRDLLLEEAIVYAYHQKKKIVVFSAGNSSEDVKRYAPINMQEVVSVGSVTHLGTKSDFSNFGTQLKVLAPGGDSKDLVEVVRRPHNNILSLRSQGSDMAGSWGPDEARQYVAQDYYRVRGTSMACPHVSGVFALVLSKYPELKRDHIAAIQQLLSTARPVSDADRLHAFQLGRGVVDAYRAVHERMGSTLLFVKEVTYQETDLQTNQSIEPGEEVELRLNLFATSVLQDTAARLVSEDGLCTVVDEGSRFSRRDRPLASGQGGGILLDPEYHNEADPFVILMNAGTPLLSDLRFRIEFGASGLSAPFLLKNTLPVYRQAIHTPGPVRSSTLADLDRDGDLEIIVGGSRERDQTQPPTYPFYWFTAQLHAFHDDGTPLAGSWPFEPHPEAAGTEFNINAAPIILDMNGDGTQEIVVVVRNGYYDDRRQDRRAYVLNTRGEVLARGIGGGALLGDVSDTLSVADLNLDGESEWAGIMAHPYSGTLRPEVHVWGSDPLTMPLLWRTVTEDPRNYEHERMLPVIANRDGDRELEVVTIGEHEEPGSAPEPKYIYSYNHDGSIQAMHRIYPDSPERLPRGFTVSDIDLDGRGDVVVLSRGFLEANDSLKLKGYVDLFDAEGAAQGDNWPFVIPTFSPQREGAGSILLSSPFAYWQQPLVGDIEGDGKKELFIVNDKDRMAYLLDAVGHVLEGWPQPAMSYFCPVFSDLDGDGELEVIFIYKGSDIYAYHKDGQMVRGFPIRIPDGHGAFNPGLTIADLNQDGYLELVVTSEEWITAYDGFPTSKDGWIHIFTSPWAIGPGAPGAPWPTERQNYRRTNAYPDRTEEPGKVNRAPVFVNSRGDLNDDGRLDNSDAQLIANWVGGGYRGRLSQTEAARRADFDANGEVNALDSQWVLELFSRHEVPLAPMPVGPVALTVGSGKTVRLLAIDPEYDPVTCELVWSREGFQIQQPSFAAVTSRSVVGRGMEISLRPSDPSDVGVYLVRAKAMDGRLEAQDEISIEVSQGAGGGLDDWSVVSGKWLVTGGGFQQSDLFVQRAILVNRSLHPSGNFSLKSDLTCLETERAWHNAFVVFGYQDPAHFSFAGLYCGRSQVVIGQVYNGTLSEVKSAAFPLEKDTPYPVRLDVGEEALELSVDGRRTILMPRAGLTHTQGQAGFMTRHARSHFKGLVMGEAAP